MKNTLVVNLFAGPGAGKSTGACSIFAKLKMKGIDCEYVSEFAKDKVWEHNDEVMKCQFYISGKQVYKISRVYGKVDVIITDSPILLGAFYGDKTSEKLKEAIVEEYSKYNNLNIFIDRCKEYNPNGRMQTKEEAIEIDKNIKAMLEKYNIDYTTVKGDVDGYAEIVKMVEKILSTENNQDLNDEKIRQALIENFKFYCGDEPRGQRWGKDDDLLVTDIIAWLEKKGEKANPYSGVSFEYNGHTWGMCARDYGVDISLDGKFFKHLDEEWFLARL